MTKFNAFLCSLFLVATANAASSNIPSGQYGGHGVRLNVKGDSISVTFGCAYGQFPNPKVDSKGYFTVRGWTETAMMRPDRVQNPTTFSGHVVGDRVDVTFSIGDTGTQTSSYVVVLGDNTPLPMCR
jgi:hypothetical protein